MKNNKRLSQLSAWQDLQAHFSDFGERHLNLMFAQDPERQQRFSIHAAGLYLDYSKNRISDTTWRLLTNLAKQAHVPESRDAMFAGGIMNNTEQRAVLHTALRDSSADPVWVDGQDVKPEIKAAKQQMKEVVEALHQGLWLGHNGHKFTDVVSIGIGGSFLGPKVAGEALKPFWNQVVKVHYVANVDGSAIWSKLQKLNPDTTLFITASKSFGTQETLTNSQTAKQWLLDHGVPSDRIGEHFVAISSNIKAAKAFGVREDRILPMWDWVGGRYSVWSAIGLPLAIQIGFDGFTDFLHGAEGMDQHFKTAPIEQNMPMIMALLGIWYRNFFNAKNHAILPYDHGLRGLPAYLQQLDMESNGKGVDINGEVIFYGTGPVIWGQEGCNGQHAFHQLLHQGSVIIPTDFILPLRSQSPLTEHHQMLCANALAQAQALMQGKTLEQAMQECLQDGMSLEQATELAPHKVMPGNKPSNLLLMDEVNPATLGAMLALYEHRTFVQGAIWQINSFDQWGVELGKQLGKPILAALQTATSIDVDPSTTKLIELCRSGRI